VIVNPATGGCTVLQTPGENSILATAVKQLQGIALFPGYGFGGMDLPPKAMSKILFILSQKTVLIMSA
jgi:hypothetical protein